MLIEKIECRSILTRTGGYLKEVASHSLNPYSGCGFGNTLCGVGCYVQSNPWVTQGRPWGGFLGVKVNAAEVYRATAGKERRWAEKQGRKFSVFLSSATEPWQPAERKYRVTRGLLRALCEDSPDILILQTHSPTVTDDLETMVELSRQSRLRVQLSIESDCEDLPGLPPPPASIRDRLEAVARLVGSGLETVVCLSPLLPMKDPERFFRCLAEIGASAVVIDHFIEGDGTLDGSRTLKTPLPAAIRRVNPAALSLQYREQIADLARKYLRVGISASGFAGNYSRD